MKHEPYFSTSKLATFSNETLEQMADEGQIERHRVMAAKYLRAGPRNTRAYQEYEKFKAQAEKANTAANTQQAEVEALRQKVEQRERELAQ